MSNSGMEKKRKKNVKICKTILGQRNVEAIIFYMLVVFFHPGLQLDGQLPC